MNRCLSCNSHHDTSIRCCPKCGFSPDTLDGFDSYAPDFAHDGDGFKSCYFSDLAELEENNFWFVARNQLILWALKTYHPNLENFLEIGCGTGYVLSGIEKNYPSVSLHGSEIFVAGLNYATKRLPNTNLMQMDAREIPYVDEFDVIGAFDMLEHIKEDNQVLKQTFSALKTNGTLILTVPQHRWLWSKSDDYACHVRRYSKKELHKKIEAAGFSIIKSTSFVTTLLPAMMASRIFQKKISKKQYDSTAELKISSWLNSIFSQFLSTESFLIKMGLNFPIGGSRLIVARKA